MKRILVLALTTVGAASVLAAPFTPGNVVVYRPGDGSGALTTASTPLFLDEYTPAGLLVQSIALPIAGTSPAPLTASGSSTADGMLSTSADGQFLAVPGYNVPPGTPAVAMTTSSTVPRAVAVFDSSGTQQSFTTLGANGFSAGNIRSAVTDGSGVWANGSNVGIVSAILGDATSTVISTTNTNMRAIAIFAGQLYASSAAGATVHLGTVGVGTPTTGGQTTTNLPGFPVNQAVSQFFLCDLDAGVAGVDTLYFANQTGTTNISKYSLVGGSWTLNNTVALAPGPAGLAGSVSGTTVTLFTTNPVSLNSLVDTSGYNANNNGVVTPLATPAPNTAFRGVAFVPVSLAPTVQSAVSRKTHATAGDFDVNLPLSGTPGLECRTGGPTGDYTVIVTFTNTVQVNGIPQAEITKGKGDIGTGGTPNGGMVSVVGNVVTIPLTNVVNAQRMEITLNDVSNGTNSVAGSTISIPMNVLQGDSNANGAVNSADVSQGKSQTGQPVNAGNFRQDTNLSGTVNSSDVAMIKSNIGNGLP